MKSATPQLLSHLNEGTRFLMADLFTFTLVSGEIQRYTSLDVNVVWNGFTFSAVPIQRNGVREVKGIEVSNLTVEVFPTSGMTLGGRSWLQAALLGELDGARLQLERAFFSAWTSPAVGALLRFSGRVADVECNRTSAKVTVNSDIELLNIKMPRNLYQPGCLHTLFDSGCTLVKASFAVNGSVTGSASTTTVVNSGLAQAAGYFDLGTIKFTSGALNGIMRGVKSYTGGSFTLNNPLPSIPATGVSFTAHPGCDKQSSTCLNKFNNKANFRGYPNIPIPETAY